MTNDLDARMDQHRRGMSKFTQRYRIGKLLYSEAMYYVCDAYERERQIKGWTRAKKLALIRTLNPQMRDLSVAGYYWRQLVEQHRKAGVGGVPD
jgi:putative endonuclease